MKKLSLKNLKLGADDMLQRNQLKSIFGGYASGGGDCSVFVRSENKDGSSDNYWSSQTYSASWA